MTNEEQLELIAQAREYLTEKAKGIQDLVDTLEQLVPLRPSPNGPRVQQFLDAKRHLNLVTTHLAEMDEHKAVQHCESPLCHGPVCAVCRKVSAMGELQTASPCDFLVTKAKRLLGVK